MFDNLIFFRTYFNLNLVEDILTKNKALILEFNYKMKKNVLILEFKFGAFLSYLNALQLTNHLQLLFKMKL